MGSSPRGPLRFQAGPVQEWIDRHRLPMPPAERRRRRPGADPAVAPSADRQASCALTACDARIDLRNSGISCQEAVAISLLLARGG